MVAPAMNKLVLVAAMLIMPMVQAMNSRSVIDLINWFTKSEPCMQRKIHHDPVGTKVFKGPKIDGRKRKTYFVQKCIGAGLENQAYLVRDGPTKNDTLLCLKVGNDVGGWEYERDFLRERADKQCAKCSKSVDKDDEQCPHCGHTGDDWKKITPSAPYFPRIHDAFEWKDKNRDGALKYVLVMDFFEGFKTLKDFVASYAAGVPPALAQRVLTEIVRITALMHTEMVTTIRKRRGGMKTTTKPLCHADYHECNIMVKIDNGQVQVRVIDPHMPSTMKPHNKYTDMVFVAKHAVMLSCRGNNPKDEMKEAVINELPTGLRRYIHEALGASNFDEAKALKFKDISDKNEAFWGRKNSENIKRHKYIKSADDMHKYLRQNLGIFNA